MKKNYAVIGGGISGLAAAHYLSKLANAAKITLFESSSRLGGWIQTTRFEDGGRHEHGPRTVRPAGEQGANTLRLVEELGLADRVVPVSSTHPAALNRYVLVDGQLHKLPSSLWNALKRTPPFHRPLAAAALRDLFAKPKACTDDSIFDFVERRFGSDVARYAIDPMVRGICAGDAGRISAASFVAGPLFRMEQESGGVVRHLLKNAFKSSGGKEVESSQLVQRAREEKWSVWTLKDGLEELVSALAAKVRENGVEIIENCPVKDVFAETDGIILNGIGSCKGDFYDAAALTCPADVSGRIVKVEALNEIPFVTVAVVTLEYERPLTDLQAFGFLVPSDQPEPILGAIFDSCSFPQVSLSLQVCILKFGPSLKWLVNVKASNQSETFGSQ